MQEVLKVNNTGWDPSYYLLSFDELYKENRK